MALTTTQREMYLAAGLPLPIHQKDGMDGRSPRDTVERLSYDAKIGTITHDVIAVVADPARGLDLEGRAVLVEEAVASRIRGQRDLGRGDKTAIRVTGLVSQYLARFLPPDSAAFLGAEVAASGGRVDLAWRLPGFGAWFDELKTWRGTGEIFDDATMLQVYRYLDHGFDVYGDLFRGVRVVTLGNVHAARLVTPSGAIQAIEHTFLTDPTEKAGNHE